MYDVITFIVSFMANRERERGKKKKKKGCSYCFQCMLFYLLFFFFGTLIQWSYIITCIIYTFYAHALLPTCYTHIFGASCLTFNINPPRQAITFLYEYCELTYKKYICLRWALFFENWFCKKWFFEECVVENKCRKKWILNNVAPIVFIFIFILKLIKYA